MAKGLRLHELMLRFKKLSPSHLNSLVKIVRHSGWTEIRIYDEIINGEFRPHKKVK